MCEPMRASHSQSCLRVEVVVSPGVCVFCRYKCIVSIDSDIKKKFLSGLICTLCFSLLGKLIIVVMVEKQIAV